MYKHEFGATMMNLSVVVQGFEGFSSNTNEYLMIGAKYVISTKTEGQKIDTVITHGLSMYHGYL